MPIWPIFAVNGLNWQCCLVGSSKIAPRIFSIAMGADYSFELNSIETLALPFFGHNILFLGSVIVIKLLGDPEQEYSPEDRCTSDSPKN